MKASYELLHQVPGVQECRVLREVPAAGQRGGALPQRRGPPAYIPGQPLFFYLPSALSRSLFHTLYLPNPLSPIISLINNVAL